MPRVFQHRQEENELYRKRLEKKLWLNVHGHERHYNMLINAGALLYQYQSPRTKKRKMKELTVEEKIEMGEAVQQQHEYHDDVCSRYNVKRETLR